jgi:hypothetical protein
LGLIEGVCRWSGLPAQRHSLHYQPFTDTPPIACCRGHRELPGRRELAARLDGQGAANRRNRDDEKEARWKS